MAWSRTLRCQECGRESLDSRWSPLCPVCFESLHHQQRRDQIRPTALELVVCAGRKSFFRTNGLLLRISDGAPHSEQKFAASSFS